MQVVKGEVWGGLSERGEGEEGGEGDLLIYNGYTFDGPGDEALFFFAQSFVLTTRTLVIIGINYGTGPQYICH